MLDQKLKDLTYVSFDIETSGAYPLRDEICELAAVKYFNGQIVDQFQTLAKTTRPMSDFIIGIHGITNEMVADSVLITEKVEQFHSFIKDSICVGHHSPFDMGFLSIEFEKKKINPPALPVLCTSLLSRKLFPESTNHKLQTLVNFFDLEKNQAHRALDDAISCLNVLKKCFDKVGWEKPLSDILKIQDKEILWHNFYLAQYRKSTPTSVLIEAVETQKSVRLVIRYGRGTMIEEITPHAFVCSPDGNFLFAESKKENKTRRYYIEKVLEAEIIQGC